MYGHFALGEWNLFWRLDSQVDCSTAIAHRRNEFLFGWRVATLKKTRGASTSNHNNTCDTMHASDTPTRCNVTDLLIKLWWFVWVGVQCMGWQPHTYDLFDAFSVVYVALHIKWFSWRQKIGSIGVQVRAPECKCMLFTNESTYRYARSLLLLLLVPWN